MRTSYSALDTFKKCPQKYKFQEIDRIPAKKGKEAIFGSLIHAALKYMFDRDPLFPTLDQVLEFYRTRWPNRQTVGWNEEEETAYFEDGIKMLKRFYERNAPWNFNVVDLESRFEVVVSDTHHKETHVLAGKIDRIDRLSDGSYEIIDYKTARKMPSQGKADQDLQLSLYSLGLQRKWPNLKPENIKLSLYFLKHGEKITTNRTQSHIDETKEDVIKTIDEIQRRLRTGDQFEPIVSPLCDYCPYKPICPAWRHLYEKDKLQAADVKIDEVIKEYFVRKDQEQKTKARILELQQMLHNFFDQEKLERVFGREGYIMRGVQRRFAYDFDKIKNILEPLGKWQEVLEADEGKLRALMKELPPEIREAIYEARILEKEFKTITATRKKPLQESGITDKESMQG